jgi:hypothetical protein
MALQKQNVSYNFTKGIDTKTDEYQVSGKLSILENGVFQTAGAVRKRNGYEEIGLNGTLTQGNAIATYQNEVVALTGEELYSFSNEQDSWNLKGNKLAIDIKKNSILKNTYFQLYPSVATHSSGYKFFTWMDTAGANFGDTQTMFYSVVDSVTGNTIVSNKFLVGEAFPLATLVFNNYFVFIYQKLTSSNIEYIKIPITTPQTPSSAVVIVNSTVTACSATVFNNRIYVSYSDVSGVKAFYLDSSFVKSAVTTVNANLANRMAMYADTTLNQLWIAYFIESSLLVKYVVLSTSLTTVLAATTIDNVEQPSNIAIIASNGSGRVYIDQSVSYTSPIITVPFIKSQTLTNAGVVSSPAVFLRDVGLYSKPFLYNGEFYIVALHDSYLQGTYFVLNSEASVVAKLVPQNAGPLASNVGFVFETASNILSDVSFSDTTVLNIAIIERDQRTAVNGALQFDTGVSEEVLTFENPMISQNIGDNLHVNSGILTMYDGVNVVEHGFNLFPEDIGIQALPYGGTLEDTSTGSYSYSTVYEWTDNQGQIHQSAPSTGQELSTNNLNVLTATVSSGSPILTNIKFNKFGVMPGMAVSGTYIPTGAYITDYTPTSITISANATGSAVDVDIVLTSQDYKAFTTDATSNTLKLTQTLANAQYFYVLGTCNYGEYTMTVQDASLLKVGYQLKWKNHNITNAIIGKRAEMSDISGNQITLTNPSEAEDPNLLFDPGTLNRRSIISFNAVTGGGGAVTYTQSTGNVSGYLWPNGYGTDYTGTRVTTDADPAVNSAFPSGWSLTYPYLGIAGEVPIGTTITPNYYTIVSINGNEITVDIPFQFSAANQFVDVSFNDTVGGFTTVGQSYYNTSADVSLALKTGDVLYSTNFTPNYVTVTYLTPSVSPYGWNVHFAGGVTNGTGAAVSKIFSVDHYVKKGNTIAGSGLTGPALITDVNAAFNLVYTDQNIAASYVGNYTIANLYSVQLNIPTLRITDKKIDTTNLLVENPVVLSVYRTQLNQSVYYRVTKVASPIYNDVEVDYKQFFDTTSDDALGGSDLLYTTGGVVENIEIPAVEVMTSYRNRLIGVPSENPYQWWYSKQVIPGSPVEFNDTFVQNIDQFGGPITGLITMDDKLIFFKQSLIYYVVGDGPTATGINNDFSQPQLISTDSGCINKKSIVLTPVGTMYKSSKGIYLLTRSLEAKYIGSEVEGYNDFEITSAILVSNFNQVRFSLSNGKTLMYDYYFQQWSVFTNYNLNDAAVLGASPSLPTYYFIDSTGKTYRETNGQYLDDGAYIKLKVQTNWLNMAGLQGYERFYKVLVLGHYKSPHNLTFNAYFDFDETSFQETVIPVETDPGVYQYRIFLSRQKCESIRFSLEDSGVAPLGEGFYLSAIAFEIGIKQGLNKMAAAVSYG